MASGTNTSLPSLGICGAVGGAVGGAAQRNRAWRRRERGKCHFAMLVLVLLAAAAAHARSFMGRPAEGFTGRLIKHHEEELRRAGVQLPGDQWSAHAAAIGHA